LRITLEDGRIGVESDTTGSGIVIDNGRDTDAMVLVERTGWSADAVLGSTLASFSDFLGLFATEAPAAGVELSVSSLSVLFTDLSGSTATYQELGDARAFRLVQDHFREVEAISARHGGALVKTMGDAIMSTFEHPARAVAAALDMLEAHGKAHPPPRTPDDRDRPQAGRLGLKVGVHAGPCLVVRANDRLDFFGTTVNEAARLQAEARSGELVITESLAQDAEVATLVRDRSARQFETDLKGLEGRRRLISVQSLAQGGDRAPPNAG
jgi:class 3 adenylate cyclase